MKKFLSVLLCAAMCTAILCGCASESASQINVIDVGGSGAVASEEGSGSDEDSAVPPQSETPPADTLNHDETDIEPDDAIVPSSETAPAAGGVEQDDLIDPDSTDIPVATTQTAVTSAQTSSESQTSATTVSTTASTTASTTVSATEQTAEHEPVELPDNAVNSYSALNHADVKGVWISYIELADILTGKTESDFRKAIGAAYDNCVSLGLNTVYVHVRSHGDAYYKSSLYPWSKYVTGTFGKAPDFDPLKIMISEAHSRGLSFQAWINPLRACAVTDISGESGYPIYSWVNGADTAGKYVVKVGSTYYLNPAYGEVVDFIAAGAAEIAANYDVDGVHIDDYFYPTTDASFDSSAYSQSGCGTISEFRLSNCDRLVSGLYGAVKKANPSALFGVSCQGSIENNYNQMYADVKKWCSQSGFTDYIMPQIYYGFSNSTQPYSRCAAEWDALAQSGGIPLIIGLSVSKIGLEDAWAGAGKTEWITDKNILSRQYTEALGQRSYGGICLYSYRSIFTPDSAVVSQVDKEIAALKAAMND